MIRREHLFNVVAVVISFVAVIFVIAAAWLPVGNVRPIRDAAICRRNLETVFGRLIEYGRTHDTFPQTPQGNLDLEAVYTDLGISESQRDLCPSNVSFDCYVFRRGLKPSELIPNWQTDIPWTIIAMDKAGNHPIESRVLEPRFRVNLLFSCGGNTTNFIMTKTEYDKNARRLALGELFESPWPLGK